jgi:hypothetical protein
MDIREKLKKAAGLFVELPPDEMDTPLSTPIESPVPVRPRTVEQIVQATPGPNLSEIRAEATKPNEPVIHPDGSVNFPGIYQMASLPESAFAAEQVLEILSSFPEGLPIETKRQTLKVTLNALTKSTGATPDGIVADASRKLAALASYSESYRAQAEQYIAKSELDILRLEAEIQSRKQAIEDARSKQAQMTAACEKESDRLDDVLEFFSMDVAPSRLAQ